MWILGKLLKYTLILFAFLVLLLLLTLLSWWLGWPLATGAVLILGLLTLLLVLYALRALYRWRDKRRFVRRVLDEQAKQEQESAASEGHLTIIWRQGMERLRNSPRRFQERLLYSSPWFITLDAVPGGCLQLLQPFGEILPGEQEETPLRWHFLNSVVLLRLAADRAPEDREELLAELVKNRGKIPLRGLLVVLDLADLVERDQDALTLLGQNLRSRIQQLMLTLNRSFPLYVLVQGLDSLPGMNEILAVLNPKELDTALGLFSPDGLADTAGRAPALLAADKLEELLRIAAADGQIPRGDMLHALESLRGFGESLGLLLECLGRELTHQTTPFLCGVYFCQASVPGKPRVGFLAGLLSAVLPAAPAAVSLSGGLPFVASTRILFMSAWLTLLLFVCGLFAVNTVYQQHVLARDTVAPTDVSHDPTINGLYREMLYIKRLDQARRAWWLPTFGQDMLARVEKQSKDHYVSQVKTQILNPLQVAFRARLTRSGQTPSAESRMDTVRELMWLCAALSDRIQQGKLPPNAPSFPLTSVDQQLWTPVTGQLLVSALDWIADGDQLTALSQDMRNLLALSLARNNGILLQEFVESINQNIAGGTFCLSRFWPHLGRAKAEDVCVPPAYTAHGYSIVQDIVDDLHAVGGGNKNIEDQLTNFQNAYFARYAALWENFLVSFDKVCNAFMHEDVLAVYTDIKHLEDMPHLKLFLVLSDELTPLTKARNGGPAWTSSLQQATVVVTLALARYNQDAKKTRRGHWQTLFFIAIDGPQLLQQLLNATHSAGELRSLLQAAEELRLYFDGYQELLRCCANPDKALDLAGKHYAAPGERSATDTDDLYIQTEEHLNKVLRMIKASSSAPSATLFKDMLHFTAQGLTVQAAHTLQSSWESEVLNSPTVLYRQDDSSIYGKEGLVQTFATKRLKPFLTRQDQAPAAARWGTVQFPFTRDFLALLARVEAEGVAPPRVPVQNRTVLLHTQPTLVNADAKEWPESTSLSLRCQNQNNEVVNRNYPKNGTFLYTADQCGKAELSINFPSFTLKRTFASFADFVQDFQYGEREYQSTDFPEAVEQLKNAGVRSLVVRILPDNTAGIVQRPNAPLPALPDRITYTW